MKHFGAASALRNLLNDIRVGTIIDESTDVEAQNRYREQLAQKIGELKKTIADLEGSHEQNVKVNIPALKAELEALKEEMHLLELDAAGPKQNHHIDNFDKILYGVSCIALAFTLAFFYISAIYMGFTRDVSAEIAAGQNTSLLSSVFSMNAFTTFGFHTFGFLGIFGLAAFYYSAANSGDKKRMLMISVAAFAFEFVIALKIHIKGVELKQIMGIDVSNARFYSDVDFWGVFMFGFVTTLVLGFLIQSYKKERSKTDFRVIVAEKRKFIQEKITGALSKISDCENENIKLNKSIEKVKIDISDFETLQNTEKVNLPEMQRNAYKVYDGWMQFIAYYEGNDATLRPACEAVMKDFEQTYLNISKA